ncbi:hypothetical protein GCM10007880_03040 [Mesorhizobium amorphae]|nr:hypothetical protein GCM10007880_03040 [Mesorhizobium amorphae]
MISKAPASSSRAPNAIARPGLCARPAPLIGLLAWLPAEADIAWENGIDRSLNPSAPAILAVGTTISQASGNYRR